jgi:hypothetical protein
MHLGLSGVPSATRPLAPTSPRPSLNAAAPPKKSSKICTLATAGKAVNFDVGDVSDNVFRFGDTGRERGPEPLSHSGGIDGAMIIGAAASDIIAFSIPWPDPVCADPRYWRCRRSLDILSLRPV